MMEIKEHCESYEVHIKMDGHHFVVLKEFDLSNREFVTDLILCFFIDPLPEETKLEKICMTPNVESNYFIEPEHDSNWASKARMIFGDYRLAGNEKVGFTLDGIGWIKMQVFFEYTLVKADSREIVEVVR